MRYWFSSNRENPSHRFVLVLVRETVLYVYVRSAGFSASNSSIFSSLLFFLDSGALLTFENLWFILLRFKEFSIGVSTNTRRNFFNIFCIFKDKLFAVCYVCWLLLLGRLQILINVRCKCFFHVPTMKFSFSIQLLCSLGTRTPLPKY